MTHIWHSEKVFNMKILLLIFILTFSFQSLLKADDIRDFQIEGISIGDSLLDYFSEEEIKKNLNSNYYKNQKYTSVEFGADKEFNSYNSVEINFLTKDNNYTIVSVSGVIFCSDNYSKCEDLEKIIKSDISGQFKNLQINTYKDTHEADKSGNSKFSHSLFSYKNGDMIIIESVNWSKQITEKNGWTDNINLSTRTNSFNQFLHIAFE